MKSVEEAKQLIEDLAKNNYRDFREQQRTEGEWGDRTEQDDCHRSQT